MTTKTMDESRARESEKPEQRANMRLAWNPYLETYVAQAPARMRRRELVDECPFCADRLVGRVEPGTQTWLRRNDFPALEPPMGECYVLIYHPEHNRTFASLSVEEATAVVALWQHVYRELAPRYACVLTWETSGEVIGQTQRHPHGQTYGVSFVPETIQRELTAIQRAEARGDGCPFCAELQAEEGGECVVVRGAQWVGFVPAYARYPFQVHLLARRHISSIVEIGEEATRELAESLLRVLRAYDVVYQGPMPYMLALHQLGDPCFHLHVELLPVGREPDKLKLAASTESAWNLWLNDAFPEDAADRLRSVMQAPGKVQ
jgi:UDPglucose--hexose-1-phosphate uridylyltransferase